MVSHCGSALMAHQSSSESERHLAGRAGRFGSLGSLVGACRTVAWGFLGIRAAAGANDDAKAFNPLLVLATAIVSALLFVAALIVLVNWVA
jgi:hypothetical protein